MSNYTQRCGNSGHCQLITVSTIEKAILKGAEKFWILCHICFHEVFSPKRALCRILGTKCVTCLYIDKFAPFHNQMSVFHNIFVKFL